MDAHILIPLIYKINNRNVSTRSSLAVTFKMSQIDEDFDQASFYSVNLDFNFQSPLPLPDNPALIPTHDDINQSLCEIENVFPDVRLDKVVNLLYNNLIAPKVPSEKALSESSQSSKLVYKHRDDSISQTGKREGEGRRKAKGEHQANLKKAQQWDTLSNKQFVFSHGRSRQDPSTISNDISLDEKRLVSRGFCENGYGLQGLKDMVWQQSKTVLEMNYQTYVKILKVVISQSYRRLEQFLIQDCNKNIKPLSIVQIRALFSILSNSQNKFQEEESFTFKKFIRITYDLESVSIFQQAAVKLYIKIQISLRGRVGVRLKLNRSVASDMRNRKEMLRSPGRFQNQRFESQSIWTAELESDLIEAIAQHRTIAKTRDVLMAKYGENVVLNNVKELKARFFKIIRTSIKRLGKFAKDYAHKVPLLVDIIDERIKIIMRSPYAVETRLALAKLYRTKNPSAETLTEVINMVNKFCFDEQARREKQVKPYREPAISSVTDKIKHNINISRKMLKNVTTPAQRAGNNAQLVFLKGQAEGYQHIVSLQHDDKLHYFRKTGQLNNKGGFEYEEKPPLLRKFQIDDGDDDSQRLVYLSDQDESQQR